MDVLTPDFIKIIASGGTTVVGFVIWYFTFKYFAKVQEDTMKKYFMSIEQDLKYKEILIGILTRLELKIDLLHKEKK